MIKITPLSVLDSAATFPKKPLGRREILEQNMLYPTEHFWLPIVIIPALLSPISPGLGCIRKHHSSTLVYRFIFIIYSMLNKDKMMYRNTRVMFSNAALECTLPRRTFSAAISCRIPLLPHWR